MTGQSHFSSVGVVDIVLKAKAHSIHLAESSALDILMMYCIECGQINTIYKRQKTKGPVWIKVAFLEVATVHPKPTRPQTIVLLMVGHWGVSHPVANLCSLSNLLAYVVHHAVLFR